MKSCQNYLCFYYDSNGQTRPQFCTCHDSSAVMTCAKLGPDMIIFCKWSTTCSRVDYELIKLTLCELDPRSQGQNSPWYGYTLINECHPGWSMLQHILRNMHTVRTLLCFHYIDVIMSAMASQMTSASIVCSTVCSSAYQRKYQRSTSLPFFRGIHQWPVVPLTKDQ